MKRIAVLCSVTLAATLLTGCSAPLNEDEGDTLPPTEEVNTDPREGWVEVQPFQYRGRYAHEQGIWKKCDGSTLMYVNLAHGPSTSISTIPNSEECVG